MTERPVLSLQELEAFDQHASAGARRRFCCPLCGQDKPRDGAHRSLSVDTASGLWTCFRCEARGKLREKWQDKPLHRQARVRSGLQGAFGLGEAASSSPLTLQTPLAAPGTTEALLDSSPPVSGPSDGSKRPWRDSLSRLQALEGSSGQDYLERRGLPLDLCLAAKVKFCPSWLGRPAVVFPLYDDQGVLVAAQGRYTDGREDPKARSCGPKKHGAFLSGHFWEQVKGGAPVIITEAPIDALSLAACGFPAMALCGKSGWPGWLPIRCAFKSVVIAFDADDAGEQGAARLAPVLETLGAKVRRLVPEGGSESEKSKDWNQMLEQRGREQLDEWLCFRLLTSA